MQFIISFIILLMVSLSAAGQNKFSLEDIFQKDTFSQKSVTGYHSLNDGQHYTVQEEGKRIVKADYPTGNRKSVVFDLGKIENRAVETFTHYQFSNDETKILFTTNIERIYRHSYTADYYTWNQVTSDFTPLSDKGRQQLATFSPDGERVAFVRNNNLFIKNLKFGSESQVTFDGAKNQVINGAPDWVYEEEFGFSKAFAWSPDNKFLAFIRFDESAVREFGMTLFKGSSPSLAEYGLYPGLNTFKYPKAGEANSLVSVRIYDVKSRTTLTAETGKEADIYIPRIQWTPDARNLVILRLNRRQNQLDILYVNPNTGDSRIIYSEKNKRFVDESFLDNLVYLDDGSFVVTSERNGYSHLYLHDAQGFEKKKITNGNFDVTAFYGYDPVRKLFYYQAAGESPLRREVYFVSMDGKKQGKLSAAQGTNRADFSKGYHYYINYFTNLSTPNLVTLYDWKGKPVRVLEDNQALKQTLTAYNIPGKEFFTFTTSGGVSLNGWMIKPSGFDPGKRYPVVMTQYSGPNSQQVSDRWGVSWNEYLAQEGFLVVCVDPRGTAARGEEFRKCTYMQLGKFESDDMVEAAKYLAGLPYVDPKNIAIWGWSYGGFMTALTLSKGGDLFKAGIAVAPVTNWRYYDNIYTERYMRKPEENSEGYDENSPLFHADKIRGRLLLVHGSADDNVHLQNSMEYAEALVQAGIPFDMAIYTNRNHGIRGGNTTMHLYRKMEEFLKQQLQRD